MKVLGIIPARYASTRFPGKPLVEIQGKTMIQRVYEQAKQADKLTNVLVATDDERILNHVKGFGGNALLTSGKHQTGTDRCAEVVESIDDPYDLIINIQGDEPFINPQQINQVVAIFQNSHAQLGTLVKKIKNAYDLSNPNIVKVVKSLHGRALYFSRSPIPFQRNLLGDDAFAFYKHIGIYGYRADVLKKITKLKQSSLELTESLEQLRWLENGFDIYVSETEFESHSVDVPEDLLKFK